MTPRLNPFAAAPAPMQTWLEYGQSLLKDCVEPSLMELVKIRASQINGCAFCLHMHAADDEDDDITLPLMLVLERLSPLERAAFLLHDVFGVGFDEIAEAIDREPATCRQLASRARSHVRAARPRFPLAREHGLRIAEAFFEASRSGDMQLLRSLLSADITAYADGGGKVSATAEPVAGLDAVIQLHTTLARVFAGNRSRLLRYGFVDGLPGFVTIEQGGVVQTTALQIEEGKIVAIYVTRNPDKLRHLDVMH